MCLKRKKMGKSKVLSRRFCLFNSGAEECLAKHLRNQYAKIVMFSARFLNRINKIRETEL